MKVLAIIGIAVILIDCYICGMVGTWDFIQTLPAYEKNNFTTKFPGRICLFFPVLVPIFCVVPQGYERYFWACCLVQTHNWISIGLWVAGTVLTAFCGFHKIFILAGILLFLLKWQVVTNKMEASIRSLGDPAYVTLGMRPLQYIIDQRQSRLSGAYLSVKNWLWCILYISISIIFYAVLPWLAYCYLAVAVLVIFAWAVIIFFMKRSLPPGLFRNFRIRGDQILAIINVVSVFICMAFAIFCIAYDKRFLEVWLLIALPVYCIMHYNKTMGWILSKVIK